MKNLVLLHGWGMTAAAFDAVAAPLSARCSVVPMALPGYDGTDGPSPYTLDRIAGAMAARAPARCAVLGWSLGALVALAWAAAVPSQVATLVLVGATPCFVKKSDWRHGIEPEVLAAFSQALHVDSERTLRRFVALVAHGDADARAVARALQAASAIRGGVSVNALKGGLGVLRETDLRPLLPRIGHRTLVVHGEADTLAPLAAGRFTAATLPNAELETIAGAAHAPFVTHGERLAGSIARFLYG